MATGASPSLYQKYAWKKAGVQAFLAFSGCLLSHLVTSAEGMYPNSKIFWEHIIFVAGVTTLVEELTYLRQWAQQYMSNGNGGGGNTLNKATTLILLSVLTGGLLFSAGCPKPERAAYTTAVAGHAFLTSIQLAHPECNIQTSRVCDLLRRASAAHNLLVDTGKVYCTNQDFLNGGGCHPPSKKDPAYQIATDKLQAALSNYEQAEADLKGAVK